MIIAFALAIAGLLLIYFEFFLPGSVMGITGGILIIASIIAFIMGSPNILLLILYLIILVVVIILVIRLAISRVKKSRSIYLDQDQEGYIASEYQKELIGMQGVAASDLRPSGHVHIDNKYFQATSRGSYIQKGDTVEVVGGEGAHLIVKKVKGGKET